MRRGRVLAVAVLMALAAAMPAIALDVQSITIAYGVDRTNGAFNNYFFDVEIKGTAINNIVFTDTTTPANDWWSLTYDASSNSWGYSDDGFATYAALTAAHPNPTGMHFYFNNLGGGVFEDQVLLGYSVGAPSGFPTITNPTHNETDVPVDDTLTWNSAAGMGAALALSLEDSSSMVYETWPVPIATTSWSPGTMPAGEDCYFFAGVLNFVGGAPLNLATLNSDAFVYNGVFVQGNGVQFTTVSEVPEPVSLMLLGTAVLGFAGWTRRRMMR